MELRGRVDLEPWRSPFVAVVFFPPEQGGCRGFWVETLPSWRVNRYGPSRLLDGFQRRVDDESKKL